LTRYSRTGDTLFDNLHYNYENTANSSNYKQNTNKLRSVDEPTSLTGLRADDIDDQEIDNYKYDEVGNLVFDEKEEIAKIEWTMAGKIKSVTRIANSLKANLVFTYDTKGHRVSKSVTLNSGTSTTFYVRDAGGNTMVNYETTNANTTPVASAFEIYGSSRIGTYTFSTISALNAQIIGNKAYELPDHQGNVRTVLSDKGIVLAATDYYPFGMVANY